jgi:hypothetical protein
MATVFLTGGHLAARVPIDLSQGPTALAATNQGPDEAYVGVSAVIGSSATATAGHDTPVPAGATVILSIGAGTYFLAAIANASKKANLSIYVGR